MPTNWETKQLETQQLETQQLDTAQLGAAPEAASETAQPFVADLAVLGGRHTLTGADRLEPTPNSAAREGSTGVPLAEFGPLLKFVSDPLVTDIFVNGADDLWVDRGGLRKTESPWASEQELRAFVVRLVASGGRHVDEANPCVDVRLHNGIRVHVVLPPIAVSGTTLSVRLPSVQPLSLTDLAFAGFFSIVGLGIVRRLVSERTNILISGAGGSGKTTLLAAMLSSAAPGERIIAIEDVAELQVTHPHFLSLEARQPNLEGAGGVALDRLVREALRMRPDRLILGECRGAELRDLLAALNTGHDGGAGTVHANSLDDLPARLEALGDLAGLSPTTVARQAVSAIGAVLHIDRVHGRRRLTAVGRLTIGPAGCLRVAPFSPTSEDEAAHG